ncbi:TPA: hypothetical protein ACPVZG_004097 [Vibrio parahaemolyticus]
MSLELVKTVSTKIRKSLKDTDWIPNQQSYSLTYIAAKSIKVDGTEFRATLQFNEFKNLSVEVGVAVKGLEDPLIDSFICNLDVYLSDDEIESKVKAYLKLIENRVTETYMTKKLLAELSNR